MMLLFQVFFISSTFSQVVELGAVSSGMTQATQAGELILQQGGNAFDAAVAVSYALSVVAPSASGIGGGGFSTLYISSTDEIVTIDGREEAPEAFHPNIYCSNEDCYLNPDCDCADTMGWSSRIKGGLAVGVPGMVAMTARVLEEYGTMTMQQVLAPAIDLAENGFVMNQRTYEALNPESWWTAGYNEETMNFWYNDDGTIKYEIGDTVFNPDHAETLRIIAEDPMSMYNGQLAQEIVDAVKSYPNTGSGTRPGLMEMSDLLGYKAVKREPLRWEYDDFEIYGMSMPTSGPATIAMTTEILKHRVGDLLADNPYSDDEFIHAFISAQNLAFADRGAYMGDSDFSDVPIAGMMDSEYLAERAALIGDEMIQASYGEPVQEDHGTSHIAVMDSHGNIASITSTIEMIFGSGITVPGRGFVLNNQLTDFEGYGYNEDGSLKANAPEGGKRLRRTAIMGDEETMGGKRPRSSTSPMIVFKAGKPFAAVGGIGGSTIIGSAMNTLFRMIFEGKNSQDAIDAPRCWARGGNADLEEELYDAMADILINERNYEINSRRVYYPQTYKRIAVAVQRAEDGSFNAGADTMRLPDTYGVVATGEEEEEPTDCTDCVSQDDYERLYRMVEAQAEQIAALESQMMDVAGLEATVNDVDTQLTNLATCLSYDSSYEPEPEPETTMEPSKSPTMMLNMVSTGVVCPNDGSRTFKNKNHESALECYFACEADADCMYFSFNPDNSDCIGCTVAPDLSNSYTDSYLTYMMPMAGRRQLSELELLRAENAALKEALSQARRN